MQEGGVHSDSNPESQCWIHKPERLTLLPDGCAISSGSALTPAHPGLAVSAGGSGASGGQVVVVVECEDSKKRSAPPRGWCRYNSEEPRHLTDRWLFISCYFAGSTRLLLVYKGMSLHMDRGVGGGDLSRWVAGWLPYLGPCMRLYLCRLPTPR